MTAAAVAAGTAACVDDTDVGPTPTALAPSDATVGAPTSARPSPSSPDDGPATLPPGAARPTMGPLTRLSGPACSRLPATGPGSRTALARQRVGAALDDVPFLSRAADLIGTADLVDTLDGQTGVTVFVPDDEALARLPVGERRRLTEPRHATDVVRHHVVTPSLAPDQLVGAHRTLDGRLLDVRGSGETFTVDGTAQVVCGLQTSNGTVYVIDTVLPPPS